MAHISYYNNLLKIIRCVTLCMFVSGCGHEVVCLSGSSSGG